MVDMDVERFFDHVNHDILMRLVAERVKDMRVLKLIGRYLRALSIFRVASFFPASALAVRDNATISGAAGSDAKPFDRHQVSKTSQAARWAARVRGAFEALSVRARRIHQLARKGEGARVCRVSKSGAMDATRLKSDNTKCQLQD